MIIKILGSGCASCAKLKENAEAAVKEMGVDAEIIKVTDFKDIMAYGVMSAPALVVDDKVVSMGRALHKDEIMNILQKIG